MVPANMHDFMLGSLTAATSFLGLLFVAMSILLQNTGANDKLAKRDFMLAEGAYLGLINIFFVALLGLVPSTNIGYVCFIMAAIGLLVSWRLKQYGAKRSLYISLAVYVAELIFAVYTIGIGNKMVNETYFVSIIVFLFAASLSRAWELTGIHTNK